MKITSEQIEEASEKWCDENAEAWNAQNGAFIAGAEFVLENLSSNSDSFKGLISDKVYSELESREQLLKLIIPNGNFKDFERRVDYYKQLVSEELPEFTMKDLLLINKKFDVIKELLSWYEIVGILAVIEYEIRKEEEL